MPRERLERTWAGQVTWAAGQQSQARYIVPTGPGTLGTVSTAPTAFANTFLLDCKGYEYAALGVWAKKVVHAEAITLANRVVHAEASMDAEFLPGQGPLYESGWQLPYIMSPAGTAAMGQYDWRAASGSFQGEGGIVSGQALNAINTGWCYFFSHSAASVLHLRIKPARVVSVVPFYVAGATVLTGTNTWDYRLKLVAY